MADTMETASAGKILIMPKGEYNASTEYKILDMVLYNGTSWVAKKTANGIAPVEGEYWQMLVDLTDYKPTGTYTGNGDATERTVNVGGVGDTVIVRRTSDNDNSFAFAIVTPRGYIGKKGSSVVCGDDVKTVNGNLVMSTADELFNLNGYGYTYEKL